MARKKTNQYSKLNEMVSGIPLEQIVEAGQKIDWGDVSNNVQRVFSDPNKLSTSGRGWAGFKSFFIGVYDFFAYYGNSHDYKEAFDKKDFDGFIRKLNSTSECGSASHHLFDYVYDEDGNDYWQKPWETFERRSGDKMLGDCDDWAGVFTYALKKAGKQARFLVMWGTDQFGDESGHATALELSSDETIGTFHRVDHMTDNIVDVAKYWYPGLRGYVVYTMDDEGEYHREAGQIFPRDTERATDFVDRTKNALRFFAENLGESNHLSINNLFSKAIFGKKKGEVKSGFGFDPDLVKDIAESYKGNRAFNNYVSTLSRIKGKLREYM